MRIPVAAVLAGVLFVLLGASPAAAGQQAYFWQWSDGVNAKARNLAEGTYRTQARLPELIVVAEPATPHRRVSLQYRDHGRWRTEDTARTDGVGRASLELNPYCEDGSWCHDTLAYRLLVNGVATGFTLTYTH